MRRHLLSMRHLFAVLLVFLFFIVLTESLILIDRNDQKNHLRKKVSDETNLLQMSLSNEINSSLNLVLGLTGYVNVTDNITDDDYQKFARVILRESDIIRNIGIAPDNIISYMYPIEGNENAVGLDYLKNELQRDAVLRAIETGDIIIAGPVDLLQGGKGFIARIPIFKGDKRSDYWGIASIVVDVEKLYEKSGLNSDNSWIEYSLKGRDAEGEDGDVFFGDSSIFNNNPVKADVLLPSGSWVIAAVPRSGWNSVNPWHILFIRISGYLIAFIVSFLLFDLLRSHRKYEFFALEDPLTGIANRRCFHAVAEKLLTKEKREKRKLYFFYFDLDKFKEVNDVYGHKAGDGVLEETVNRILKSTRDSDLFARMGGDEFIFLPSSIPDRETADLIAEKIKTEILLPFYIGDNKLNIGSSIGISIFPDDGETIDQLITNSDRAMYNSKKTGRGGITYFSEISRTASN